MSLIEFKNHLEFEQQLADQKFKLVDFSNDDCFVCKHSDAEQRWHTWYIQQCACCFESDRADRDCLQQWLHEHNRSQWLEWYKYQGCDQCQDGELSGLGCGGHYNNFRSFCSSTSTTTESVDDGGVIVAAPSEIDETKEFSFRQVNPDPTEELWLLSSSSQNPTTTTIT